MRCPYCKKDNDRVLDTRSADDGTVIRRRRECHCRRRFTTHERLEELPLRVVKKNGQRQPFSREKVLAGVQRAIEKRLIPAERAEALVDEVERELLDRGEREVPSRTIGELVAAKMRALDGVAYVRRAIEKRPIPAERAEALVDEVERELLDRGEREVPSRTIGELVAAKARSLDDVAYVRFASVYREFQAVDEFVREIQAIHSDAPPAAPPPPRQYHGPDGDEPTI